MRSLARALVMSVMMILAGAYASAAPDTVDLHNPKVVLITGEVNAFSTTRWLGAFYRSHLLPGDVLLIIINSPGGHAQAGDTIIAAIEAEKAAGMKVVCIGDRQVASMGFNIMTHCNERYATPKTKFLAHKAETYDISGRKTAHNLRLEADRLDAMDDKYRRANAAAMHLTLAEYDLIADNETIWTVEQLILRGYLLGIVNL